MLYSAVYLLGKDIRTDNRATQKLRREVEKAKRALSAAHQTRVEIESFFDGEVCTLPYCVVNHKYSYDTYMH